MVETGDGFMEVCPFSRETLTGEPTGEMGVADLKSLRIGCGMLPSRGVDS